jgi:hypothetical protein
MTRKVICPYCQTEAKLVNGKTLFGKDELKNSFFWRCRPCKATVGCHPGTKNPMGRLANAVLRKLRNQAHAMIDPKWKQDGAKKRTRVYAWLAGQLGIPVKECHIGHFDEDMCRRVIEICRAK